MRKSLFGAVILWATDLFPFLKKVSGVHTLVTIRLFSRKISIGPSYLSLRSSHVCRKNTSIVYSWRKKKNQSNQMWASNLVSSMNWCMLRLLTLHQLGKLLVIISVWKHSDSCSLSEELFCKAFYSNHLILTEMYNGAFTATTHFRAVIPASNKFHYWIFT